MGLVRTFLSLILSPLGLGEAALLAAPAGLVWLTGRRPHFTAALWLLVGFTLAIALIMAPQVFTGYLEYRYFSALFWALLLTAGCLGVAQGITRHQRAIIASLAGLGAGVVVAGFCVLQTVQAGTPAIDRWSRFDAPVDVRVLEACVAESPGARILVLGDDSFAARAGALGGLGTMMEPRNMADGRLGPDGSRAFIAAWGVDYVLVQNPARGAFALQTFPLKRTGACPLPLYRVVKRR